MGGTALPTLKKNVKKMCDLLRGKYSDSEVRTELMKLCTQTRDNLWISMNCAWIDECLITTEPNNCIVNTKISARCKYNPTGSFVKFTLEHEAQNIYGELQSVESSYYSYYEYAGWAILFLCTILLFVGAMRR